MNNLNLVVESIFLIWNFFLMKKENFENPKISRKKIFKYFKEFLYTFKKSWKYQKNDILKIYTQDRYNVKLKLGQVT